MQPILFGQCGFLMRWHRFWLPLEYRFYCMWSLHFEAYFFVNTNSQINEEEWARPFLYDCCMASANCLLCCRGGVGGHCRRCSAERTTCPCYYLGKLYSLGNRCASRDDGNLYIFATPDVLQASAKRCACKRVSPPGSTWTGWLWVIPVQV